MSAEDQDYLHQVQDMELTQHKDIKFDGTGDVSLVSGVDNIMQSVAIMVMQNTSRYVGSPVTTNTLSNLESDTLDHLNQDPQIEPVSSVDVFSFNRQDSSLNIDISLERDHSFRARMVLPDEIAEEGFDI